jgi:hypothetical protein
MQIGELQRQLEFERRSGQDAETYKVLVTRVQAQNRELQQEVERLKDARNIG